MKPLSYLQWLRLTRCKCKSQAFVEFAIILPIFLVLMMAVFDYSFMIMRMQVMAMAAREGANTATRQSVGTGIPVGLNAAYTAARSAGVDFSSAKGGIIITHVWYNSSNVTDPSEVLLLDSNYVGSSATNGSPSDYSDPMSANPTNAIGTMGTLYGGSTSLITNSAIIVPGTSWTSVYRKLPIGGTNLVDGDTRGVYAVEVMYTNVFITPIGNFLSNIRTSGSGSGSSLVPKRLYDAAFYGVIIAPTPQTFVSIPVPSSVNPTFTKPKKHSPRATPGIPAPTHVAPGTGNNRATPAVPGPHIKNNPGGTDPGGGG